MTAANKKKIQETTKTPAMSAQDLAVLAKLLKDRAQKSPKAQGPGTIAAYHR
ncbi:MAG: hypothetical protein IOD12_18035 [Silvanigrellales bacterium]|jgi:hypothetical protein|nr:hypothetical protein [Silvanigrellales bacterium]